MKKTLHKPIKYTYHFSMVASIPCLREFPSSSCLIVSEAKALESHEPKAASGFGKVQQKLEIAVSELDVMEIHHFIEIEKGEAAIIQSDIKDAKRRINAAKGPKKKSKEAAKSSDEESEWFTWAPDNKLWTSFL